MTRPDPELARDLMTLVTNAPPARQDKALKDAAHVYDVLTNPEHPRRTCRACKEARAKR